MAIVTGTLADAAGVFDPGLDLRLIFTLPGAAVTANRLIHSRPIVVDEFTGSGGNFTVNLVPTDAMTGIDGRDVYYDVKIERRVSGADYMPWDHPGWKLPVPAEGGEFHKLVLAPTNPAQIWVGPAVTPESNVPAQTLIPNAYTGWIKTNALPGAPNYFEWE